VIGDWWPEATLLANGKACCIYHGNMSMGHESVHVFQVPYVAKLSRVGAPYHGTT